MQIIKFSLPNTLLFFLIIFSNLTFAETPPLTPPPPEVPTEITVAEQQNTEALSEQPEIVTLEQAQSAAEKQKNAEKQAEELEAAYKKLFNTSDDEVAIETAKQQALTQKEIAEQLANQATELYEKLSEPGREAFDKAAQEAQKKAKQDAKAESLADILKSISTIKQEIINKKQEQKAALVDEEKERIAEELKRLSDRISSLKTDFSILATSIDPKNFFEDKSEKISWEEELQQIFSPFIIKLKEASERPRKIESLKSELVYYQIRMPDIQRAIATLETNQENTKDKDVEAELLALKAFWQQQEKEFETKEASAKQLLHDLENQKASLSESADSFLTSVKTRATNVALAILAFAILLSLFRFLNRTLQKINPLHKNPKYLTWANMTDLLFNAIGIIIAATAGFFVLYSSGDWLLIGFALLVIIALVWGLRNAVLTFWEQTRLVLNIGTVRKGERVIYQGLPYHVDSIGIFSILSNPLLTGGVLRLPIQDLIGLRSRPSGENEAWFPCKEGDFVLMNQKTWRQIKELTPQRVKFTHTGMEESMPTSSFLSQNIRNLSKTEFWVGGTLYISYDHRFMVMDEIVPQLENFLAEEFSKHELSEFFVSPWVDFSELTDTSLGVMAWVKVSPEGGCKYNAIKMLVNKICLRAANQFGWEIKRFHQIEHHPNILEGNNTPHNNVDHTAMT